MRAQLINILTLGAADGKGCFFPNGLLGEIVSPAGYNASASGIADFPAAAPVVGQARPCVNTDNESPDPAYHVAMKCSCPMSGSAWRKEALAPSWSVERQLHAVTRHYHLRFRLLHSGLPWLLASPLSEIAYWGRPRNSYTVQCSSYVLLEETTCRQWSPARSTSGDGAADGATDCKACQP